MIGRAARSLRRRAVEAWRRWHAPSRLARLERHPHPAVRALAEALSAALAGRLAPDERAAVEAIEARRDALRRDTRTIETLDFGAGDGHDARTPDEMARGVVETCPVATVARGSKPPFWGAILFGLVRRLRPASSVELGTCVGISAAYQAAALALDGHGRLATLEGSPEIAAVARETLAGLGLDRAAVVVGPFDATLAGVLERAAPVSFFFNDGHHDRDATLRYLDAAAPHLAPDAVVVFDDIDWSAGMRAAWAAIETDVRFAVTVDLGAVGVAIAGSGPPETLRLPL